MITATRTETSTLKAEYNLGYVWLISIVAAMGGLLFGWDWVVIGGAKPFFEPFSAPGCTGSGGGNVLNFV